MVNDTMPEPIGGDTTNPTPKCGDVDWEQMLLTGHPTCKPLCWCPCRCRGLFNRNSTRGGMDFDFGDGKIGDNVVGDGKIGSR